MAPLSLIGRALSCLLRKESWVALMGDLAEERARRVHADGPRCELAADLPVGVLLGVDVHVDGPGEKRRLFIVGTL